MPEEWRGVARSGNAALALSSPVDVELVFAVNDSIVTARASSRQDPGGIGSAQLSFTNLLEFDRNEARRLLEKLRKAAGFSITPVITDFDPRFNNSRQLWFEQLFEGRKEMPDLGDRYDLEDDPTKVAPYSASPAARL